MFGRGLKIFKLLGFEVKLDWSWIIIATLIVWTLAKGIFPENFPGLPEEHYWWMGVAGALGLFASIILHELCHSLVSRRFGIPMRGITLFIFGGVAEMNEDPPSAKAEFLMAAAGPLSSLGIALSLYGFLALGRGDGWSLPVGGTLGYLAYINVVLAAFNLVPAFPLDGGRILRSALWKWKGNVRWATRVASAIGSGFAIGLIFLGVFQFLMGNVIGGIWFFLIGLFLRNAAQMSYQQVLLRKAFEGEKVRRFMSTEPVGVPRALSVKKLVEDYMYRFDFKMFPVVEDGRLIGCVTTRKVKEVPKEEWDRRIVDELADQCSLENTVSPETDAVKAVSTMSRNQNSRLLVVEGDRLLGIVTLKDMLRFFAMKMELEK